MRSLSESTGMNGIGGREIATMLRPIATPLVMSGFEPDVADTLGAAFQDQGFVPMAGAARHAPRRDAIRWPVEAGRRDRRHFRERRSRTGGDRNGHAYRWRPRLRIRASDVQPRPDRISDDARLRLHGPSELVLLGETLGDERSDRHASRRTGRRRLPAASVPAPSMLPVTMTLESDRGGKRTFKFNVVRDQLFTPLMTYTALVNTLGSYERQFGTASYAVAGKVASEEIRRSLVRQSVRRRQLAVECLGLRGRADFGAHQQRLRERGHRRPGADGQVDRGTAHRNVERVWLDDTRPRAGRTVPLKVLLRTYRGEDMLRTIPIAIPQTPAARWS